MLPQPFERRLLASFFCHSLKRGKLSVYVRLSPPRARIQNTTFPGSHTAGRTGNGERLFFRQFLPLHLLNMLEHSAANLFFSGQGWREQCCALQYSDVGTRSIKGGGTEAPFGAELPPVRNGVRTFVF